jgi:predicted ATP-grasp superfamily ATP-dependent carboligase
LSNDSLIQKRTRVLVTDADTPKALAVVRAIGQTHDVWTSADSRFALAGWSRFIRKHIPYGPTARLKFADWVLSACRERHIQIVITPEEASSLLVARAAQRFNTYGIRPTTLPLGALETALDKGRTIQAATTLGIPVPATRVLSSLNDAIAAAHELGYPVVVKPRFSRYEVDGRFIASDGVGYANSDDQLLTIINGLDPRLPAPLIQRFIPGTGRGVCLLSSQDGRPLAEFAHERLRDYRPTGSGSVLRRSVRVDPALRDMAVKLLRHIGAHGIAMVEFRIDDESGAPYLMEINGRFWGSLQLAVDAGVNFPLLLIDHVLGRDVQPPPYAENVTLRWWLGDMVRTLRVLKGKPPGYIGEFPSRISALREFLGPQPKGTRGEILRFTDCWPGVIEPISLLRRALQ